VHKGGYSLHEVALTKPHVALNGGNVALESIELGLGPQEGIAEVAHADDLGIQARVACSLHCITKKSIA
jgi:hypothetical protein